MNTLNIAIFGFGTVGKSVVDIIENNNSNNSINIKYVAVRDIKKLNTNLNSNIVFTDNHDDIWNDESVNVIIELIGGTGIAKKIIYKAIKTNRDIITANKAVLAEDGNEIFAMAKKNNVTVGFEASVAGGIPIIQTLKNHYSIGKINKIEGILNGTCNYMLSNLENDTNLSYNDALTDAQEKGFAESDPSADVDGWDSAAKIAILSSMCFGSDIPKTTDFAVTGISKITSEKIAEVSKQNKKIRLIASAEKTDNNSKITLSVHPEIIDKNNMFYSVNGPDNMVIIHHEYLGEISLKGAGAGGNATAMSVISDIISL